MRQELKRWAPVIFFSVLIIVLAFIWYVLFPTSAWEETPNYLLMYVEFFVTRPVDAFLTVSSGPGVRWASIATYSLIIVHIVLYIIGKQKGIQYTILNRPYIFYLVFLGLFAISFQNASQNYGWYLNPDFINPATGKPAPGYVDTWTHIVSPWLLGALIVPFALERYLGWDRKLEWLFIFAVLMTIALGWEIVETLDVYVSPDPTYFNYPMDSIKDIIMGAGIGTLLSCWIYERLVVDFGEKAETPR